MFEHQDRMDMVGRQVPAPDRNTLRAAGLRSFTGNPA
jgi:hypothetical protein